MLILVGSGDFGELIDQASQTKQTSIPDEFGLDLNPTNVLTRRDSWSYLQLVDW